MISNDWYLYLEIKNRVWSIRKYWNIVQTPYVIYMYNLKRKRIIILCSYKGQKYVTRNHKVRQHMYSDFNKSFTSWCYNWRAVRRGDCDTFCSACFGVCRVSIVRSRRASWPVAWRVDWRVVWRRDNWHNIWCWRWHVCWRGCKCVGSRDVWFEIYRANTIGRLISFLKSGL